MWTVELTERAASMYLDGMPAQRVAEVLQGEGYPVTKNAVVGVLHRGGYNTKPRKVVPIGGRRRTIQEVAPLRVDRIGSVDLGALAFKAIRAIKARSKERDDPVDDMPAERPVCEGSRHLTVVQLTSDNCHWPQGNGPFTFCGLPAVQDKPYCIHHCGIAYRPPEVRKR